jgi:hypothetical protein
VSGKRRRGAAIAAAVACVLSAAAASAQAAPTWERLLDPAPGGTVGSERENPVFDMVLLDGTPYLATVAPTGELTVWRPSASGARWLQVGGPLNHSPGHPVSRPTLVASGNTVWVAWAEDDGSGDPQVRLARLSNAGFQEAVGGARPINRAGTLGGYDPQVAVLAGRPYVAYREPTRNGVRVVVARLSSNGDSFEHLTSAPPGGGDDASPRLTASGGRLYLAYVSGREVLLNRLAAGGSSWERVTTAADTVQDMADGGGVLYLAAQGKLWRLTPGGQLERVGGDPFTDAAVSAFAVPAGVPYAAGSTHPGGPDTLGPPRIAAFTGGAWQPVATPAAAGEGVNRMRLVAAADGTLWMAWDSGAGSLFPPHAVHVARFAEPGTPYDFAPDPSIGGPSPDDAGDIGDGSLQDAPPDTSGFTDTQGHPIPPNGGKGGNGNHAGRRGACANPMAGTARGDRLVGSRLGERIVGGAGNDRLFGRRGRDCVSGGAGNDLISGGPGADDLNGDSGNDRIVTGGGRDAVAAGRGNDSIDAAGGSVDLVNCGSGRDTVRVSRNDLIKGCERVIVVR